MAGSDTAKEDDELEDALEEFDAAREVWAPNYDRAREAFRFGKLHEHWPEKIRKQREMEGRPCLTIPLLPPIMRQVVNDGRQNKPGIKISAADSAADPDTADIFSGLIKQIERGSHADVAYDTALDHSVTGGFGWFKINTKYCGDDSFEQDIVIQPVTDAFSITPDPDSTSATSEDWNVAFETEVLSEKAFKRRWPDADPISFDGADIKGRRESSSGGRSMVAVCYAWRREETQRKIVALSAPNPEAPEQAVAQAMSQDLIPENMIVDLEVYEKNKALFDALGVTIVGQPRSVPSYKVDERILSGADVLERIPWAGKWIPIIPVYGSDVVIEGERTLEGMVGPAMDEQRRHNFHMTSATESTALAPKTPFIGRKGQFVTDSAKWDTANVATHAYIEWDGDPGDLPPQRQQYAGVPIGDFQMAQSASESIKAITGIHNASLGAPSNETSGRAIYARQKEGDVGSFHYTDNLSRAIRHGGEQMLDLIPKVYSTPRMQRIIGPDDKEKQVPINQHFKDTREGENGELEEFERIYDLRVGKYDLVVKAGPSFNTQREEFVALITEIIRSFPQAAPVLLDLVVKNYDLPDAETVVKRLEALMPASLKGESPEAQQLKAQIQKMAEMMGQLKAENASLKADKSIEERGLDIKAYEAETKRGGMIVGKDGAPYDPTQAAQMAMTAFLHIMQSPDILPAMQGGASPEDLAAMLAQRMGGQQQQEQPLVAA